MNLWSHVLGYHFMIYHFLKWITQYYVKWVCMFILWTIIWLGSYMEIKAYCRQTPVFRCALTVALLLLLIDFPIKLLEVYKQKHHYRRKLQRYLPWLKFSTSVILPRTRAPPRAPPLRDSSFYTLVGSIPIHSLKQ